MSNSIDRFNAEFWRIWQSDDFEIFYQKDWFLNDEPIMPIIKFQMESPEYLEYYANVSVEVFEMNANFSLDEQIQNLELTIPKLINGLDNLTINKNTNEHLPFLEVLYSGIIEGVVFQYSQYQWFVCNKIITLTFLTELETVLEFSRTKEIIFNNFKIK